MSHSENASEEITRHIPHRPPFLFVDEIIDETDDRLTARLQVRPEFDFFRGHYPGNPIMPGVLISEAVFQAGAVFLARKADGEFGGEVPVLTRIEGARFRSIVRPGDELTIEVRLKEHLKNFYFMRGSVKAGARRVMTIDFSVALMPPESGPAEE